MSDLPTSSPVAGLVEVRCNFKLRNRDYKSSQAFEALALGLRPQGWVWQSIKLMAHASKSKPQSTSDARAIRRLLEDLSAEPDWRLAAAIPTPEISVTQVLQAFGLIEGNLARARLSESSKKRASALLRSRLTIHLEREGFGHAKRLSTLFRTQFKADGSSRPLISDLGVDEDPQAHGYPLGATPHRSPKDLREAIHRKLTTDLDRIKTTCLDVLTQFSKVADDVLSVLNRPYDDDLVRQLAAQCVAREIDSIPKWVKRVPIADLVSAYYQISHTPAYWPHGKKASMTFLRVHEMNPWIEQEAGISNTLLTNYFYDVHFGTYATRMACQILLAEHTAWNGSSITSLTERNITGTEPPYEIQSFKTKTDDHTPISIVDVGDEGAIRAIAHLRERLKWMKQLRLVKVAEQRLWLKPVLKGEDPPMEYVSFGSDLKKFQNRYGLPSFSIDQVRTQVLATIASGTGGLDAARRKAGHGSIQVTGGYLDQLLLQRLNSSINLQYQKELEKSIVYEMEIRASKEERQTGKSLLYPIGDGASCKDPGAPPDLSFLSAGVCKGNACHQGDGCKNRTLVVNQARIEEAIRAEVYYVENWERLLSENPDSFWEYSLPAMLFSITFLAALSQGPYAHVVKRLRNNILGQSDAAQ